MPTFSDSEYFNEWWDENKKGSSEHIKPIAFASWIASKKCYSIPLPEKAND